LPLDLCVRQHDVRVALHRRPIAFGKLGSVFGGLEQQASPFDHFRGFHGGDRFFRIEHLVDLHNHFGNAMQPREPGIADHQLKEGAARGDAAVFALVSQLLGIEQSLVQAQQGMPQFGQAAVRQIRARAGWEHGILIPV